ncbi:hypothetical protein ACH47B_26450 [Rhodococcus sp. NPDC019627]|uniref:hypothetical protein n=1 Tax=unclassified Rhodococcus (in: high G+C Gram-positive bacteria) TaxID=192944 RepID=UPI00340BBFE5
MSNVPRHRLVGRWWWPDSLVAISSVLTHISELWCFIRGIGRNVTGLIAGPGIPTSVRRSAPEAQNAPTRKGWVGAF